MLTCWVTCLLVISLIPCSSHVGYVASLLPLNTPGSLPLLGLDLAVSSAWQALSPAIHMAHSLASYFYSNAPSLWGLPRSLCLKLQPISLTFSIPLPWLIFSPYHDHFLITYHIVKLTLSSPLAYKLHEGKIFDWFAHWCISCGPHNAWHMISAQEILSNERIHEW